MNNLLGKKDAITAADGILGSRFCQNAQVRNGLRGLFRKAKSTLA